uniref:DNA-binding protein Ikaros-like isoform X2 n=2 Tax=Myxine glutinosa TaxID=7769 RepID=UPI00358F8EE5
MTWQARLRRGEVGGSNPGVLMQKTLKMVQLGVMNSTSENSTTPRLLTDSESAVNKQEAGPGQHQSAQDRSPHTSPSSSICGVNSIKVEDGGEDSEPTPSSQVWESPGRGQNQVGDGVEMETMGTGEDVPEAADTRDQDVGRLSCDICGLSCAGPNVLLVHKRSHTGERPFQCTVCGASFTQKGNLLRHLKLHSEEKPFKCSLCNYACRRRDALAGHIKTHAVGKPHKCMHCGRSYKQRSSLEEHKERCHGNKQHFVGSSQYQASHQQLPVILKQENNMENIASSVESDADPSSTYSRLPYSLGKRKSFTPQKLIVEKRRHPGQPDGCSIQAQIPVREQDAVLGQLANKPPQFPFYSVDSMGLVNTSASTPNSDSSINLSLRHQSRLLWPEGALGSRAMPAVLAMTHGDGPLRIAEPRSRSGENVPSPSLSCQDSTDTESGMEERNGVGRNGDNRLGRANAWQQQMQAHGEPYQVFGADGTAARTHWCGHCEVLFLDHVMYTIHMGCHGYRNPLECNVCGHRSRDRYEFASHMVRGDHLLTIE